MLTRKRNFHKRNKYIGRKRNAKEIERIEKMRIYFVLSPAFGIGSLLTGYTDAFSV